MRVACGGLVCALILWGASGCGKSKPETATTQSTPATTGSGTTTTSKKPAPSQRRMLVRAVALKKSSKSAFGATARLSGPGTVQVRLLPPAGRGGKAKLTIDRPSPHTLRFKAPAVGGGKADESTVKLADGKLKIDTVLYNCQLPPKTFCPFREFRRKGQTIKLTTKGGPVPVLLVLVMARKTTDATARLVPLAPPAPGSPVQATALLAPLTTKPAAKPKAPSTDVTVGADARVRVLVRAAPGSPARGRLRIAVPRTSGQTIEVQAGGVARKPSSTAKIHARKGRIRLASVTYSCQAPPATFCPLGPIQQTGTGLVFKLQTPRVPVALLFTLAAG